MPCRSSPKRLFMPVIGSSSSSIGSSSLSPGRKSPSMASSQTDGSSYTGDRVRVTSTGALFARVVGELYQRGSRRLGRQHRRSELEPGDFPFAPQIDPIRIDAGHPPLCTAAVEQAPGILTNSLRVILVHMSEDLRFGGGELADLGREQ